MGKDRGGEWGGLGGEGSDRMGNEVNWMRRGGLWWVGRERVGEVEVGEG